ncbi:hypothetical protein EUGRSUZ_K02902 [Eucalyptus grandis]|uniref:Uncharacterized protein n=2 Tax=Eucalyptus grandis TaxID=71139 RepID=A0ACC3IY02_EUCGR|nr:hypothetical protein EUGRSUZ_K02902 [Eucalyptus grandis]
MGSALASFMFIWAIIQQYCPYELRRYVEKYTHRLTACFHPHIKISINEYTGERLWRSKAYAAVEAYLSKNTSKSARRLKAELGKDSKNLVLTIEESERVWWASNKITSPPQRSLTNYPDQEMRFYRLTFHKKHREVIAESYLKHVIKEGKEIRSRNTQRKLYTNSPASCCGRVRVHVGRRVGQRKKKGEKLPLADDNVDKLNKDVPRKDPYVDTTSSVTLSGLLNFIDGLWSAYGAERIIVFITNYVENLDPALIRSGRMDKHIELSYCCFEGFKVLAKNYLSLETHPMFNAVCGLMSEVKITPADVAESLMPKSPNDDAEKCLSRLIQALEEAKETAAAAKRASESRDEAVEEGAQGGAESRDGAGAAKKMRCQTKD